MEYWRDAVPSVLNIRLVECWSIGLMENLSTVLTYSPLEFYTDFISGKGGFRDQWKFVGALLFIIIIHNFVQPFL